MRLTRLFHSFIFLIYLSSITICAQTPGYIYNFAGTGSFGYSGDGGIATSATLNYPQGLTVDGVGNIYIEDSTNYVIRKVDTSGIISTYAGTGIPGDSGDGGAATGASIYPTAITADRTNAILYIADISHCKVRKVTLSSGVINAFAGTGTCAHSGDGGPATSADLDSPVSIAVDNSGNVFIGESFRIRKVDTTGVITTYAGTGTGGTSGDGGAATSAAMTIPTGITFDLNGDLYFSQPTNAIIRKITTSTGIISRIAGTGTSGFSGDGGAATSATLNGPDGLAIDSNNALYIADTGNYRIRKVDTGIISTVAGTGISGSSGDGNPATSATFNTPTNLVINLQGDLLLSDLYTNRVRSIYQVSPPLPTPTYRPSSYSCSSGINYNTPSYPDNPLYSPAGRPNNGYATLYSAETLSPPYRLKRAACTWSGFASYIASGTMTLYVTVDINGLGSGSGTVSASIGGTPYSLVSSLGYGGVVTLSIPSGTDISTVSISGNATSSTGFGDEVVLNIADINIK